MGTHLTERVRAWLADHPEGILSDLYAAHAEVGIRPLNKVLEYMVKRGELRLPDPTYHYKAKPDTRKESKQHRIWTNLRNMAKAGRIVDQDSLVTLSQASPDYVRKYLYFLEQQGYVVKRQTGIAVLDKTLKRIDPPIWTYRPKKGGKRASK